MDFSLGRMIVRSVVAVLLVGFACVAYADGDVVALTESNFDSKMEQYELSLVKFYAPCRCFYVPKGSNNRDFRVWVCIDGFAPKSFNTTSLIY